MSVERGFQPPLLPEVFSDQSVAQDSGIEILPYDSERIRANLEAKAPRIEAHIKRLREQSRVTRATLDKLVG